jgi:spoIIIJ-associated protein
MIKDAIGVGETEKEALQNACDLLGKDTIDVEFEVLQRPEKKVMGLFGGSKAKIRAWIQDEPADIAESYLKNILKLMGLGELTIKRTDEAERTVFDISGEDVGSLIGKRGETLDAVQ